MYRITITEVIFDEYRDVTDEWALTTEVLRTEGAARLVFEAVLQQTISFKRSKVMAGLSFPRTIVHLEYKEPGVSADESQYVDGFTVSEYTPDD